jgi:hypothetical protein
MQEEGTAKEMFDPDCVILLSPQWAGYFDLGLACIHPESLQLVIADAVVEEYPDAQDFFGLDLSHVKCPKHYLEWAWSNMQMELTKYEKPVKKYLEELKEAQSSDKFKAIEEVRKINLERNRTRTDGYKAPSEAALVAAHKKLKKMSREYVPQKKSKKCKNSLSWEQRRQLLEWYNRHQKDPYPSESALKRLSRQTGALPDRVNNWFERQRSSRGDLKRVNPRLSKEQLEVLRKVYTEAKGSLPNVDIEERMRIATEISISRETFENYFWRTVRKEKNKQLQAKPTDDNASITLSPVLESEESFDGFIATPPVGDYQTTCCIVGCVETVKNRLNASL